MKKWAAMVSSRRLKSQANVPIEMMSANRNECFETHSFEIKDASEALFASFRRFGSGVEATG